MTGFLDPGSPLSARNILVLWARGLFVRSPLKALTDASAASAVGSANALGWYVVLFLGVAGLARSGRRRDALTIAISAGVVSVVTTSLVALGADPTRHRVVVAPLLCALGAVCADRFKGPWTLVLTGLGVGAAAYNLAWMVAAVRGG